MIERHLALTWLALGASVVLCGCGATVGAGMSYEVLPRDAVGFQPLNPLRGDASPQAGVLWGDIRADLPTGTLIEFADGFSSPPHIHNITYRGVVIAGEVHNDDPDAAVLWMGPGSFWTQPAGETHITAARPGAGATAFLEILEGPYLVRPAAEAFDNGERPVNLAANNIVWQNATMTTWVDHRGEASEGPHLAHLWGNPAQGTRHGSLLRIAPRQAGVLVGSQDWLRAVVIRGPVDHRGHAGASTPLTTGSYFGADGGAAHGVTCNAASDCLIYISTRGNFRFRSERR